MMEQVIITLPSIPSSAISKQSSSSAIKFKRLPLIKDDLLTDRLTDKQSIQKLPSKSLSKRNLSAISLMNSSQSKEIKKQKLMLNLIEKKIREGRYCENEEVSADLNCLKGEHSQYSIKVNTLEMEIAKFKQRTMDVKGEKQLILGNQAQLSYKLDKIRMESDMWKSKCDQVQYQKAVSMNMLERQIADNKMIQSKVYRLKEQQKRKVSKEIALEKREVDFFEKEKLTQRKYQDLKKNSTLEAKKIKELLEEKQKSVQLRAMNQIGRWERKRELISISESVIIEESEKAFNKQYHQILGHVFLSNLMDRKFERLMQNNQRMVEMFNQASNTYGPLTPQEYNSRYFNSEIERNSIQQNIKKLEKAESASQAKSKQLEQRLNQLRTEYLQMGLQLQKQHNLLNLGKTSQKKINVKMGQEVVKIQIWIDSCLRKLADAKFQVTEMASTNEKGLNAILQQLRNNLLQQTK